MPLGCYIGCDYDRICFRIEIFYIVSVYGLINLDALQSFTLFCNDFHLKMRTMYVLWF